MITMLMTGGVQVLPQVLGRVLLAARGWFRLSFGLGLGTALLSLLVGAALAGCGQARVPIPTCGTVDVNQLGQVSNDTEAAQAETCFYQGFQQCRAVSLGLINRSGVDTGAQSIYSVQTASGGRCSIAEADYAYVNTSVTATTTATCTGLSQDNSGLLITSCSSGRNVSIPAPSPTPTPTSTSAPTQSPSP